jgi:hemin uptake protein HemP
MTVPSKCQQKNAIILRSADLFGGARVVTILHGQEEYRLQITAAGKLILTK